MKTGFHYGYRIKQSTKLKKSTLHFKVDRLGHKNPNAKSVKLYNNKHILQEDFLCMSDCKKYLKDKKLPSILKERIIYLPFKIRKNTKLKYIGWYTI